MTKVESWIAEQIAECKAGGEHGRQGVIELVRATLFFAGRSKQMFGMVVDARTLTEADALREQCKVALRGWFDALATEPAEQIKLYEDNTRLALGLELPEPAALVEKRAKETARADALAKLGAPSATLPENVRADLAKLRDSALDFAALAAGKPDLHDLAIFEWLPDTWPAVIAAKLSPLLLPIAGAEGNYLALLVDGELLAAGQVPVVYYFHEEDPMLTLVFPSCAHATGGTASPEVARVIELLNAFEPRVQATELATRLEAARTM